MNNSQSYKTGSVWEHLLYGVGTLTVVVGPLLVPGLTFRDWILGFFGSVVVVYILACLLGVWRGFE